MDRAQNRIPIMQLQEFLLVSIQVELDDHTALQLQDDLTQRVSESSVKGVLIDISGVWMIDSFIGRTISDTAAMARMLGAETVVVGMRPAVAITLVELGLPLRGVRTALDMDSAMEILHEMTDGG